MAEEGSYFFHLLFTETEERRAGAKDRPHKYSRPDTQWIKPSKNKLSQADRTGELPLGLFQWMQSVSGMEAKKWTCTEKNVLFPSMSVISSGGEKMLNCTCYLPWGSSAPYHSNDLCCMWTGFFPTVQLKNPTSAWKMFTWWDFLKKAGVWKLFIWHFNEMLKGIFFSQHFD